MKERAIVTPTNEIVNEINSYLLSLILKEEKIYLSSNTTCKFSSEGGSEDVLYPIKFLNSLKFNDIPHHDLQLKIGSPIMLFQNIN